MLTPHTPIVLCALQVERLTNHLDAVREGGPESIHDARVTTRRLRELLELLRTSGEDGADVRAQVKRAGQALGRVRDLDVRIELLTGLESRLPPMAPALYALRQSTARVRPALLRKTIKRLEALDLGEAFARLLDRERRRHTRGRWDGAIRRALVVRARGLQEAIVHATGVYFPNRIHGVRIALKQMRYAIEIASAMRIANLATELRDLRKTQDVLGELHDRQTLLDNLDASLDDASLPRVAVDPIAQVLEADIHRLHERYLGKRARLVEMTSTLARVRPAPWARMPAMPAVATGALAVASGVYFARRAGTAAS